MLLRLKYFVLAETIGLELEKVSGLIGSSQPQHGTMLSFHGLTLCHGSFTYLSTVLIKTTEFKTLEV